MIYRFNYTEGVLEFVKNRGRAYIDAESADEAIRRLKDLFKHVRDETAEPAEDGKYLVNFWVSLDYRRPLVRQVERSVRLIRDLELYKVARYVDRYIIAAIYREIGYPEWLDAIGNIKKEMSNLRKAAVVAREVSNVLRFVDWDICIHNFIEMNTKEGHQSRVIRKVRSDTGRISTRNAWNRTGRLEIRSDPTASGKLPVK